MCQLWIYTKKKKKSIKISQAFKAQYHKNKTKVGEGVWRTEKLWKTKLRKREETRQNMQGKLREHLLRVVLNFDGRDKQATEIREHARVSEDTRP